MHRVLADFFKSVDPCVVDDSRRCEELPYQLMHSRQLEKLQIFCLDMSSFRIVWKRRRHDMFMYWRRIGGGSIPANIGQLYLDAVAQQAMARPLPTVAAGRLAPN